MVKKKEMTMLLLPLLLTLMSLSIRSVNAASVYNYEITSVTQTAPDTIVVSAQCEFCTACNPNDAGNPGCTPFEPGEPWVLGSGYMGCGAGYPDGRFAAVRLISTMGLFDITQKLVCDPTNWPLGTLWAHNFVFTGLTLDPSDTITAYADFYCSWCRHWYSAPVTITPGLPKPGQASIDYKTTDATAYDFGDVIEVTIEVNTTLASQFVIVDTSLIDPNGVVQDYESWTGTIVPGPDPITQYLDIPSSGTAGTWKVFVTVLNSTGDYQDSEENLITVGKVITCATVASVWTTNAAGDAKVKFNPGETVYLHWLANGNVNITVYYQDGTVDQQWLNLDSSGVKSFVPGKGTGYYNINCTACKLQTLIAYGTIFVIPETLLGTVGPMIAAIASMLGCMRLRRRKT